MLHKTLLCSVCAVALTACGGGSGGNGGAVAVVPPPPPTNAVPAANVTVNKTSVDEGQPFTLDGTGSSDADGDALTYSWTQISGPAFDGAFGSDATLELTVPELTDTAVATFQLEVSDGTLSDRASVEISFANISQSPKADFELVQSSTISTKEGVRFVRLFGSGFRDFAEIGSSGGLDFFRVEASDQGLLVKDTEISSLVPISADAIFHKATGYVRIDGLPFLAGDEAANVVDVVIVSENGGAGEAFQTGGKFDVEAPCAIETPEIDHIIIGQRSKGLSLLTLEYRSADEGDLKELDSVIVEQVLSSGQSFCGLGYTGDTSGLFAVDYAAKSVSLFEILKSFGDGGSNVSRISFESEQIIPLDLPAGEEGSLEIIKTFNLGRGVLILLTDGQHDGSHHMVYVDYRDGAFIQKRYSWSKGVPSDVGFAALYSNRTFQNFGVVVASNTSSEAIVFTNSDFEFAELTGPQYMEIGLGAKELIEAPRRSFSSSGLLVTYPEKNEIRFLSPR